MTDHPAAKPPRHRVEEILLDRLEVIETDEVADDAAVVDALTLLVRWSIQAHKEKAALRSRTGRPSACSSAPTLAGDLT